MSEDKSEREVILDRLDTEILRYHTLLTRGSNVIKELDALQDFRLKAFGSKLELPKDDKYEGCQRVIF